MRSEIQFDERRTWNPGKFEGMKSEGLIEVIRAPGRDGESCHWSGPVSAEGW